MKNTPGLLLLGSLMAGCAGPKEPPPNFIFILTDDQRWDAMHCAGNDIIYTPNIDQLAADGIRFTNAFVTTPICAASRASLLTGLYERTHDYTFTKPPVASELLSQSYPYLLRMGGYHTGFIGKLGVTLEKGWVDSLFDDHKVTSYPYWKDVDGERIHLTDLHGRYAMDFLEASPDGKPFCLSLSFWAPHAVDENPDQYFWPEWCDTLYESVYIPEPATGTPEVFEQHPDFVRNSFNRERWHWRYDTPEKYQRMVKGYYRMISGVDAVVGRIREKLKELGLDKNTVIVFMGDNGYFMGERQFAGKWLMYEQSLRVPLIVYDPGVPARHRGRTTDITGLNIDIAPTLVSMARLEMPGSYQGMELTGLIRGGNGLNREYVLFEHLWDFEHIPPSEAVRTNDYKLIRYLNHPGFEEFYDLTADPDELNNLISVPIQQERVQRYNQILDSLRVVYGH